MFRWLHRLLLLLPPELAHCLGIWGLKIFGRLLSRPRRMPLVLSALPELKFTNRVGLAAGFDKDALLLGQAANIGFGFMEVGTVTPHPQKGNPKPRLWRVMPNALINKMGFNSGGLSAFRKNCERWHGKIHIPVLANIGKNLTTPIENALADYTKCFEQLKNCVDGFVVNLSSPNTPGLRDLQNEKFLTKIVEVAPMLPLFFKFDPDMKNEELIALCDFVAKERRVSGVVLTNTSKTLALQYGFSEGGLSGVPLFKRSLECVSLARSRFSIDKIIIGVGGISTKEEAIEMLRAGADLIEVYTGFVYNGIGWLRELADECSKGPLV